MEYAYVLTPSPMTLWSLTGIMGLVLVLPFVSHKIERNLEVFLFVMGALSVTASRLLVIMLVYFGLIFGLKW